MRRREFLGLVGGAALMRSDTAQAQPSNSLPRVGFLGIERPSGPHPELDAFLDGLRALGYVAGQNILIERRMADFDQALLPRYARELVALKVSAIVAFAPAVEAAMAATHTIPIVIRTTTDPVVAGYVGSMARPGSNVTGVSSYSGKLYGKRLELLRDILPKLSNVGVLWNDESPTGPGYFEATRAAAGTLGIEIVSLVVHGFEDFPAAFQKAADAKVGAVMPLRDPIVVRGRSRIAEQAVAARLPAIYDDRQFCEAGGFISYGTDLKALHRRVADYVVRILAGSNPADLPVEEPTKFELVVNLKTAKALGLAIPQSLLLRADEVIE